MTKADVNWWSVLVETAGPDDEVDVEPDDSRLDDLADLAEPHSGVVTAGAHHLGVRLSLVAATAADAVDGAQELVVQLLTKCGLPAWPIVRLEAVTDEELEAELHMGGFPDVLGSSEVAELLGVSRQRLHELRRQRDDFPEPIIELAATPIWVRAAIDAFLERWDRKPGRPRVHPTLDEAVATARAQGWRVQVRRDRRHILMTPPRDGAGTITVDGPISGKDIVAVMEEDATDPIV